MKNINILFIILLLTISAPAFAQPGKGGPRHEKIEALKVSFLTTKLDLTPEEAKVFWPVYNQYQKEMDALQQQRRQRWQNREEQLNEMSEKEISAFIDDNIKFEQQELDIRKKYHQEFKSVLPVRKVALLYQGEREFKIMLLNKLRERQGKRH